jgi:hypothetical protein
MNSLAAKDGYSKAIGAIGEGLFVKRLKSMPIFPPADVIIMTVSLFSSH